MPPAPRVLQVVLQLDPGGTERLVVELVRRLHPDMPQAVCCLDAAGLWAPQLTAIGVDVTEIRRQPGFRIGVAREVAHAARRHRATVVHCHHYSPFVYGRLASFVIPGVRIVFTEHGRLSDAPPSKKRSLATRLLSAGVRDLYAVSHDLRRHLLEEGFPDRMAVVWNGIDQGHAPGEAEHARARARLGVRPEEIAIGTIGRLDPVKDFVTLVRAFAVAHRQDPRLRLFVIGDGAERAALGETIAAEGVGDAARLFGHREDVAALLPGLDLYVNSSVTEGISLTILEAMAAERPVVATAVGGNPEVVEEGRTGRLVPARDAATLAAAVLDLTRDPERARAFGMAGRQRVLAHFTLDRMVARYAEIYQANI